MQSFTKWEWHINLKLGGAQPMGILSQSTRSHVHDHGRLHLHFSTKHILVSFR